MSTIRTDEETPLLQAQQPKKTPLRWSQFSIILLLQFVGPLTAQAISPFAPQLIRDIGITHGNEGKVGHYVGLLQSLFFLTQAMTILHWSRLSDEVGRKPVILIGIFGLSLSMYCFGLSKTFWVLVLSRSLNGVLNGNVGVIKSMIVELTDSTNVAQAYAYTPIAWCTGGTLGPIIGGFLARPADQFPNAFGRNEFLKKYPYFLACAVPATISALAWIVAYYFLKETVKETVPLATFFGLRKGENGQGSRGENVVSEAEKPLPLRSILTPRVVLAAGNYAALSLLDMAFRSIQPLFLSTPISLGGLGMDPPSIGKVLAIYGICNGIFQVFFFAKIHDRFGSKRTFLAGILSSFPAYMAFPIISYSAKRYGMNSFIFAGVILQAFISIGISLSFGAIFIFISAASPNKASLGTTNGLSQMTVSFMRAIGPAAASSLFSISIEKGYLNGYLVYYVLLVLCCIATYIASLLPQKLWVQ